jgi:hypothetical protein
MQAQQPESQFVPWTSRDVWIGLIVFGLWLIAAIAVQVLLQSLAVEVNIGVLINLEELLLLLPVWWLTVHKYQVKWEKLGLRAFTGEAVGLGCGLMLLSFAFNTLYSWLLALFDLRIQADLAPLFQETTTPWLILLGGAIVAPVVEEIFFRGFVFAGLLERYSWKKAATISSAIFALLHLTPTAVIPLFITGWIFAFLYYQSRSIWPAILMHVFTNTLALGMAYLSTLIDGL